MRQVFIDFTSSRVAIPIFSWFVRLFEKTNYSHVRIRFRSNWLDWTIIEASGSSVKVIGAEAEKNFPVKLHYRYEVLMTDTQYRAMIHMLRFAGVKYGKLQLLGIAIKRLFSLKKNPLADGNRSFVCSELLAYFLFKVMGLLIPDDECPDFDSIGPRGIKEWVETRPDLFRKVEL